MVSHAGTSTWGSGCNGKNHVTAPGALHAKVGEAFVQVAVAGLDRSHRTTCGKRRNLLVVAGFICLYEAQTCSKARDS
jgi:hypothetical protein